MKTLKDNYMSLFIIFFAVILSLTLQYLFNLPLIAGAFIGVLLGIISGFVLQKMRNKDDKNSNSK
ncbi:hypothetical protein [Staphylococcus americanisciuri]|uniref:LapA family protein n=1 Tax=Staphylococcus americanisciuri TaxID=2973940 RepID=A0ABT2EYM0_9STAP|nr:hypothetical protein [Staphylococcus americanisciuri]MCS4485348.1 hypothetical protein [Staphylococcus americanisciuri]